MAIELNHTIVPCFEDPGPDGQARDKTTSAKFYADILGLTYLGVLSHFEQVKVNDSLTLDFDDAKAFMPHHYAFKVSEDDFDAIFGRIKEGGLTFGSGPFSSEDMDINHREGGRGLYFADPNNHLLEILTV
jgi:catechol 2,3-dioxygenase-like lactoylglutathione lyase family enzyme